MNDNKIEPLFDGDKRIESFYEAVLAVIKERTECLTLSTVVGTLEIIKTDLIYENIKRTEK